MIAVYYVILILTVAADLLIKLWAKKFLLPVGSINVLPNILNWTYVENRGVSFGILHGKTYLITILTSLVILACIYAIFKQYFASRLENYCIAFICGGGLGNLIDRMINGYVIDYIDINPLFNYPVFNFADCCIVVAVIILCIKLLFTKDEKDTDSI